MNYDDVKSIPDLCRYITMYASGIFVRVKLDGKYQSLALTELPAAMAIEHALRFVAEGRVPVRIVDEIDPGMKGPGPA